jgi:hypothetical protein
MKRLTLLTVMLLVVIAAGAVAAVATTGTAGKAGATGSVGVKLRVDKFVTTGHRLLAHGTAIATYRPHTGAPTVVRRPFTATVALPQQSTQASTCPVLTLELDQVSLDLLGLHVDLSKVILTVTANAQDGSLGKLFCKVASGGTTAGPASASTARTLTAVTRQSGFGRQGMNVGVPTQRVQALGPGPCSIVDLLLGPLHLELLGLIVDLNQIHLQITADPNGGVLGSALCSIAAPATTTTITPAPGTP